MVTRLLSGMPFCLGHIVSDQEELYLFPVKQMGFVLCSIFLVGTVAVLITDLSGPYFKGTKLDLLLNAHELAIAFLLKYQ